MNSSFILASFQVFHLFSDLTNLSCLVDEQRPNENKQFVRSFHICGGQRMSPTASEKSRRRFTANFLHFKRDFQMKYVNRSSSYIKSNDEGF